MSWMRAAVIGLLLGGMAQAGDWPQFRGPGGSGVSLDAKIPRTWSDAKNVRWKTPLPGPGASSPIVYGRRVYVTCYSGYGVDPDEPGQVANLKRHLVCIDRDSGKIVWSQAVAAVLPEDRYGGMGITEHGYASNTPLCDGQRVYVFFGKSGVLAFDLDGKQLWRTDVGHESSNRRWGSSASLILDRDHVIVNASEESRSIRALDKATGKEVWKAEAAALESTYATPVVVELADHRREIVIGVPNEVWGLNADTGMLKWFAEVGPEGNVAPSPVAAGDVVYVMGGYPGQQTSAVRAGGKGDVTKSHVLWTSRSSSYIPSPVLHDGKLYWVSDQGQANCLDAQTGKSIYRERLPRAKGGGGKPFYASVVLAGQHVYAVSRVGVTYVLPAKPTFEVLARNALANDNSEFNASPAVSDGQLFLRSNRYLYCIAGE